MVFLFRGSAGGQGKEKTMSSKNNLIPETIPEGFTRVDAGTGEVLAEAEQPKDEIRFKIFKHFGVIGKSYQNREIELNWVSWNDGYAKFDIRAWDRIHQHMSKGITLRAEEAMRLRDVLNLVDFSKYGPKKPEEDDEPEIDAPAEPENDAPEEVSEAA